MTISTERQARRVAGQIVDPVHRDDNKIALFAATGEKLVGLADAVLEAREFAREQGLKGREDREEALYSYFAERGI